MVINLPIFAIKLFYRPFKFRFCVFTSSVLLIIHKELESDFKFAKISSHFLGIHIKTRLLLYPGISRLFSHLHFVRTQLSGYVSAFYQLLRANTTNATFTGLNLPLFMNSHDSLQLQMGALLNKFFIFSVTRPTKTPVLCCTNVVHIIYQRLNASVKSPSQNRLLSINIHNAANCYCMIV